MADSLTCVSFQPWLNTLEKETPKTRIKVKRFIKRKSEGDTSFDFLYFKIQI